MSGITANPLRNLLDYTDDDSEGPITEQGFKASASLEEGVSGVRKIDTTYENTDEDMVNRPRSEHNSLDPESDTDKPWRNRINKKRGQ